MKHQICDSEWRKQLSELELKYWNAKSSGERHLWLENVSINVFRRLIVREMAFLSKSTNISQATQEPISKDDLDFLADAARFRIKERHEN